MPLFAEKKRSNAAQDFLQEKLKKEEVQRRSKQSGVQVDEKKVQQQGGFFFDEKPCFLIKEINIQGNKTLLKEQLAPIIEPYTNHCLGKRAINSILQKINQDYINRGYITSRALLPKQDLSKGLLDIVIIEGKVAEIMVNDNSFADKSKRFMAMPQQKNQILNLRDLEQGIDQLNRAPSAGATMKIMPGEEMGESRVVISTKDEDQFRGRIGYDNEGSKADKYRLRLGLEADNLFALNDSSSLYLIGSQNTNALAFNTGVPFRNFTLTGSYSYSEYLQVISPIADVFGFSTTKTAGLDYLLFRDGRSQTKVGLSYTHRYSKRYLLDVALEPQRSAITRLFLNKSYRNQGRFWLFELGLTQGLDIDNQDKNIKDKSTDPARQFNKLDASITYSEQFKQVSLNNSLNGQIAFSSLYGQDQISIGGKSSVRGFGEGSSSGDNGIINKTTLNINWFRNKAQQIDDKNWFKRQLKYSILRFSPSLFLEVGHVYDKANEEEKTLIGGGFGISYQYSQFSLQASIANGIYSNQEHIKPHEDFYLSIKLQAF